MQNTPNISPEELAQLFYGYREMLASDFGFQSNEGCVSWEQILPQHRNLMVASARLVLRELTDRQTAGAEPSICQTKADVGSTCRTGLRHSA
jgi:hypothetical protein